LKAKCPSCGIEFDAKRNEKGAADALTWRTLPDTNKELLAWWLSSSFANSRLTKDEIEKYYGHTTIAALVARISELYALDLVTRHERQEPRYPKVTYSLNVDRAIAVLNNGCRLKA
jgi:hypothetical protein